MSKKDKKKNSNSGWIIKITLMAFIISFMFSFASESMLPKVNMPVGILLLVLFIVIGVVFDMVGVSITAADIGPFNAMSAKKIKGANVAIKFLQNASKVSSFCNDVVGDICGILTGAAGANIALRLLYESMGDIVRIVIISSVSAVIAGLTIFGKACFKKVAIDNSTNIILRVGKFLKFFSFKGKKRAKK